MIYISTSCLKGEDSRFTKDVFKVLEVYRRLNIKNIELGSVHSYIKDLTKIKKYQKENNANFIIHGFFPPAKKAFYLNFASKNKEVLKKSIKIAKAAVELCNELSSPLYSTHAGFYTEKKPDGTISKTKIPKEEAIEICAVHLTDICDYAADYNIKIALENTGNFNFGILSNLNDFRNIFKKANSKNLGALIDIGHASIAKLKGEAGPNELIRKLKGRVFEMHMHKSSGEKDSHLNIDSAGLLKDFEKGILRKAALTLEATCLTPNEILKGKEILSRALS